MPAHLYVDVSSHGFGHLAQVSPVLNELRDRLPGIRLTVRSALPREVLSGRIHGKFDHIPTSTDIGMRMAHALKVLPHETALAHAALHEHWDERVVEEADMLRRLAPDLVLSDVSYLAIAAAARAGIPSIAMCSLNWADIYWSYCKDESGAAGIKAQMVDAYQQADLFLKTTPAMPMTDLPNTREIGVIASAAANRKEKIRQALGLPEDEKLVLIAMGGMEFHLPMAHWDRMPGVRWIVPAAWGVERPDTTRLESLGMPFYEVMASCDGVIGKPGYGTFAEAGLNGIPMLYVPRPDWPEEPCLVSWLSSVGRCLPVAPEKLEQGDIQEVLQALWKLPEKKVVQAEGIAQAVEIIQEFLG
jgi:hypothetical protein